MTEATTIVSGDILKDFPKDIVHRLPDPDIRSWNQLFRIYAKFPTSSVGATGEERNEISAEQDAIVLVCEPKNTFSGRNKFVAVAFVQFARDSDEES
jgi:hypothetical protein